MKRDGCFLTFDRKTGDSNDLVTSLDDKIEVQFTIEKKRFILTYKVKDLESKLEDL